MSKFSPVSRRPYRPASKIGANDQKGFREISRGFQGHWGGIEEVSERYKEATAGDLWGLQSEFPIENDRFVHISDSSGPEMWGPGQFLLETGGPSFGGAQGLQSEFWGAWAPLPPSLGGKHKHWPLSEIGYKKIVVGVFRIFRAVHTVSSKFSHKLL